MMRLHAVAIRRSIAVLGAGLAAVALTVALPGRALAGETCPNGQLRAESSVNAVTGRPYDLGLPECRAYEMVSPLGKQAHDAALVEETAVTGDAVMLSSKGNWGEPGSGFGALNRFVAYRDSNGWSSRSMQAPASLIEHYTGFAMSPTLTTAAFCGNPGSSYRNLSPGVICILTASGTGTVYSTPEWRPATGLAYGGPKLEGASADLSTIVFTTSELNGTAPLLPDDTDGAGLYEVGGLGGAKPTLRLVNVADDGSELTDPASPTKFASLGVALSSSGNGNKQNAVSDDGKTVYFTATPPGGVRTLYARTEKFHNATPEAPATVAISNPSPSECTTCSTTAAEGIFQAASANGAKAFFLTDQQLINGDTDAGPDLYEYDLESSHHIADVSAGNATDPTPGAGADVLGVTAVSDDGSHVYFVAKGALTTKPNDMNETASAGAYNLYGYDTSSGETKFVAGLSAADASDLWSSVIHENIAQTTPDGQVLIFASYAALGNEAVAPNTQNVYRYDFQTGELVRVSHSAGPGGADDYGDNNTTEGMNATFFGGIGAGSVSVKAIDGDGSTIVFETKAKLQEDDVDNVGEAKGTCRVAGNDEGCDVYEWHAGRVSMVSDGTSEDPKATGVNEYMAGISESGADIFFQSRSKLVGQDTDELVDVYDARIDGGFAAPTNEPSCEGEECQGPLSGPPGPVSVGSAGPPAVGNLIPPPANAKEKAKSKKAQTSKRKARKRKLKRALRRCRDRKSKKRRARCEANARMRFGATSGLKGKASTRRSARRKSNHDKRMLHEHRHHSRR